MRKEGKVEGIKRYGKRKGGKRNMKGNRWRSSEGNSGEEKGKGKSKERRRGRRRRNKLK